jgi:hypothetical protein
MFSEIKYTSMYPLYRKYSGSVKSWCVVKWMSRNVYSTLAKFPTSIANDKIPDPLEPLAHSRAFPDSLP